MVTYQFYTEEFLGESIPEKAFPAMLTRAEEALSRFERDFTVTGEAVSRAMALCAMAEALYEHQDRRGIREQTVGSVRVRYEDGQSLRRCLYEKAATYLDIYRGKGK